MHTFKLHKWALFMLVEVNADDNGTEMSWRRNSTRSFPLLCRETPRQGMTRALTLGPNHHVEAQLVGFFLPFEKEKNCANWTFWLFMWRAQLTPDALIMLEQRHFVFRLHHTTQSSFLVEPGQCSVLYIWSLLILRTSVSQTHVVTVLQASEIISFPFSIPQLVVSTGPRSCDLWNKEEGLKAFSKGRISEGGWLLPWKF